MKGDAALRALADEAGVSVTWRNYADEPRTVSPDTLRAVLTALGLPCANAGMIAESRAQLRERAQPQAPATAGSPERAISVEGRPWGLAAQTYGLRREGDGGIGDAAAVAQLAESAARRGADMLALSPMHALFPAQPDRYGPYSPSSRLFLNPLYAAPAMLFGAERVTAAAEQAGVGDELARLEAAPLVEWPAASTAKLALLHALFADIPDALRGDLAQFEAEGGDLLASHACFEALQAEQLRRDPKARDWREWPIDLRDATSPAVGDFARTHRDAVRFHVFLQWIVDRSLAEAQRRAKRAGMQIGLIADLAVGMDPAGSHAWSRPDDVLRGLSIGAPPDLFNPRGQQWGITSFSPHALRETGFAPFLATVRAALRNAGGVRIDHAMGLQRLWLVPDGASPADGAYLQYPLADMLHLLALESQRHQAIVVGEDLGTVPPGFREAMDAHGIYGMRVLWFERHGNGYAPPARWGRGAVAMTSTHDLPTLAGWWQGADIALREAHGVLGNGPGRAELEKERARDRASLWRAMRRSGTARGTAPSPAQTDRFVDAALAHTTRADCALCLLPLEDLLGQIEQPNLPGTIDEHPNWRRRAPGPAAALIDATEVSARLNAVAATRGAR